VPLRAKTNSNREARIVKERRILCGPLRISAISALNGKSNAEIAKIRRERGEDLR